MHTKDSFKNNLEATKDVLQKGKDDNWSSQEYLTEIKEMTNIEREALRKGEKSLNKAKTLEEKINEAK